jgi:hypothetical protein
VHDCGLSADVTTGDGTTPFHYAVWQGHMMVCKWLVYSAACNFASVNEFGCNAIQWVAQTDNLLMCRFLSALGLDLSIINFNGHSALHKAASKGQARVCAWLLNEECLGIQHMQPDQDGNTPAVMARLDGFDALADALDAAVAELQMRQQRGANDQDIEDGPFRMEGVLEGVLGGRTESTGGGGIQKGSNVTLQGGCVRAARLLQMVRLQLLRKLGFSAWLDQSWGPRSCYVYSVACSGLRQNCYRDYTSFGTCDLETCSSFTRSGGNPSVADDSQTERTKCSSLCSHSMAIEHYAYPW